MAEKVCICPVIVITVTKEDHVSESEMKRVADSLHASVSLEIGGVMGRAVYGKHRSDCPCGPTEKL